MTAYLFVLIPFALYLPMFIYETVISLKRLGIRNPSSNEYVDATWEVTHTFLVIGITNFIWLFSSVAGQVAKAVYWGLIITGFWFIVRAIFYLHLFVIGGHKEIKHSSFSDYMFAVAHLGVLAGIIYTVVKAIDVLATTPYTVNTQFIPYMWPGLIFLLSLGALPIYRLYRNKD